MSRRGRCPQELRERSIRLVREQRAHTLTFASVFPLALESLDRVMVRQLVEDHLLHEREFWLAYPLPSVAATEPSFDPEHRTRVTWRGPSHRRVRRITQQNRCPPTAG